MSASRRHRVFIGLQEISGYYSGLESGLNAAGVAARFVNVHPHPFGYTQTQSNPTFARQAVKAVLHHRSANRLGKHYWAFRYLLSVIGLLFWSLNKFDAYIFAWGQSFLPGNLDLLLLRVFRKRVIVNVGHGSEARPPYMSYLHEDAKIEEIYARTRDMSRRLHRLERWATCLIGLPTTAQMLRKEFINFYALGIPAENNTDLRVLTGSAQKERITQKPIRFLHIPSKPEIKGSVHIRAAIEQICESRPEVEYLELTGVSHDEVMQALAECDIVIDQVWSDIPMSMVGLEAATFAKPSMIGGYAWNFWETLLPPSEMPPSVRFEPERLVEALERCVEDIDQMRQLGFDAHRFVTTKWSAEAVGNRFKQVIVGEIPREWMSSPFDIPYGYGGGLPKEQVLSRVSLMRDIFGWKSFFWTAASSVYSSKIKPKH